MHVEGLYTDLRKQDVSAAMQKKIGVTLGVALQHAVKLRLIPFNPSRGISKPRVARAEMKCLDAEQTRALLDAAKGDRLAALYVVWVASGVREGELFALTWADVDLAARTISITKTLEEVKGRLTVKDTKTAKSRRLIVLPDFAAASLAEHRKVMLAEGNYEPDKAVFPSPNGSYLRKSNFLRRSFRPLLKKAGLPPIRPYDLRHTSAPLLLAGESAKVVSERLGHSTATLTLDVYSHVLPGMQERAAAKLQDLLENRIA